MSTSLTIRMAVPADARQISDLLSTLGYELTPEQVEREHDARGTDVVVAERDGRTVGVLVLHTRRHLQLASVVTSIDAFVVDPAHRGAGIGAALVAMAVKNAEAAGSTIVDVNSAVDRVDARRFYERHGFDVVSHHFRRRVSR